MQRAGQEADAAAVQRVVGWWVGLVRLRSWAGWGGRAGGRGRAEVDWVMPGQEVFRSPRSISVVAHGLFVESAYGLLASVQFDCMHTTENLSAI